MLAIPRGGYRTVDTHVPASVAIECQCFIGRLAPALYVDG